LIYVRGLLAGCVAAFVVFAYTFIVMTAKTKTIGRGAFAGYFGNPLFWITIVVAFIYVYKLTIQR